jgi:hypothetical protein
MSITGLGVITQAFNVLNVFMPGEPIPPAQSSRALSFLNLMMGSWAQQALTVPSIAREVFTLTAGKGGPSNPYTIGIGANLNTVRPANQSSVVGAGLNLNASSPVVEIPRDVLTDSAYQRIQIKELQNALFTSVYYNPTFATTGFGTVNLWPVPNTSMNDLVLYLEKAITSFADLTTTYEVPPGYEEALVYNLARRLAKPWGQTVDADLAEMAIESRKIIKRKNLKMIDLENDFAKDPRGGYNINTGNM